MKDSTWKSNVKLHDFTVTSLSLQSVGMGDWKSCVLQVTGKSSSRGEEAPQYLAPSEDGAAAAPEISRMGEAGAGGTHLSQSAQRS